MIDPNDISIVHENYPSGERKVSVRNHKLISGLVTRYTIELNSLYAAATAYSSNNQKLIFEQLKRHDTEIRRLESALNDLPGLRGTLLSERLEAARKSVKHLEHLCSLHDPEYRRKVEQSRTLIDKDTANYNYPFVETKEVSKEWIERERRKANSFRGEIMIRDQNRCRYCGANGNKVDLHLDHIFPVSKGGLSVRENLQMLCDRCNLKKSAKIEDEYRSENLVSAHSNHSALIMTFNVIRSFFREKYQIDVVAFLSPGGRIIPKDTYAREFTFSVSIRFRNAAVLPSCGMSKEYFLNGSWRIPSVEIQCVPAQGSSDLELAVCYISRDYADIFNYWIDNGQIQVYAPVQRIISYWPISWYGEMKEVKDLTNLFQHQ